MLSPPFATLTAFWIVRNGEEVAPEFESLPVTLTTKYFPAGRFWGADSTLTVKLTEVELLTLPAVPFTVSE
jgi:hypothetical protein